MAPADTPRDGRKSPPTDSAVSAETVRSAAHQNRDLVERTASRQEHELREILDLVPHHIVVLGAAGKLIYDNRAMLEHYGWTIVRASVQALEAAR